jgi:hypothetical protein
MPAAKFVRDNAVLLVGLTLPVLLMLGFLAAASLPESLSDPPKYDLVFSVPDYQGSPNLPVNVRFVVKGGVLTAQYTRISPGQGYAGWRKLYLFEAAARTVRQLEFGIPADVDAIETMREDTVPATASMRLDTRLRSPDGYELSYGNGSRGGLLSEIFFSSRSASEPRLRKGAASVELGISGQPPYTFSNAEFIGWVTAGK